jgi:dienelactone hydrolase
MADRFVRLPQALLKQSRWERLGPAQTPVLLAHPDWRAPAPVVLWLHGRTAHKELDSGRYLRWIRAGIAACAIDLPGHGERAEPDLQVAEATLLLLQHTLVEIDHVVAALRDAKWGGLFDPDRMAIGGMSAGGMITLRRLCDDHPFRCASVEGTTGSFSVLPHYLERHGPELYDAAEPIRHLDTWPPIPLLAFHSEADQWVPIGGIREFVTELARRYQQQGVDPSLAQLVTWPSTGAPHEHLGFGRVANDAKNLQTQFFARHLHAQPPSPGPAS